MSNANVLVMNRNYIDSTILFASTYSSQLAAAPATNVYDKIRRSQVWRSAGQWEVTNANKGIVLQEAAGVNQTVNIAVATYTTDATFLAAVKAALDSAAGSAVYTVARDATTNKIVITSDGGGGAIFRLMCTNGSFTAADLLGFSTGADRTGALTYTADSIRIHTTEWLRWDLGSNFNPAIFAMIGTKVSGLKLSSTATVTLQGNSTDVWTSPTYSQVLTWNQDCMSVVNTAGLGSLRYWRLLIVDRTNPLGYVELSNVYLGEVFDAARGDVQFPFDWNYLDYSLQQRSEWGTGFAASRDRVRQLSLTWFGLTIADTETLMDFVESYGTVYPFWLCLDPNSAFSTNIGNWIVYARFDQVLPGFPLKSPGVFGSDWKIREEA